MFFSHLSPHLAASLQGTTIIQLNPGKDATGLAIANQCFTEGIHYWEIICPFNTEGVKIGIAKQQEGQFEGHLFEFKTTTQRVVGVLLNLDERTLQFYLNGNLSTNRGVSKLEQCPWYPCVQLQQWGNQIFLSLEVQDRSAVGQVEAVQLQVHPEEHHEPLFTINNNAIHQFKDRLVSTRNCPLKGQQIKLSELNIIQKMGLVYCNYNGNNDIVHFQLDKQTVQQLKNVLQHLRYQQYSLIEQLHNKPQDNQPDILLQEITAMLPNQEPVEQAVKQEEKKFTYSVELCRIAQLIILQLIEQFEEVRDVQSAKMRLQTFTDHPATRNPFEVVELGHYLQPGNGVKYAQLNDLGVTYSKLILRSEINAEGKIIPGKSERYFSLRNGETITIYNGEAELFKVCEVDLRTLGPYEKHVKQLEAQNDEAPSNIYKILENYINGETEKLTLYNQSLLEKLVNMGFDEQTCKETLIQTNNNFENALDILSSSIGEWQCKVCTLLNKETNTVCEACEAPKPEEQPEEQFVIKQAPVIIEEKEEIGNEISEAIVNGSIDHVLQVHWDGNIRPLQIVSVHNGQVLSLRSVGYSDEFLDQFFINEEGWYCKLTNQWSKHKDYQLLLQSKTSRQIIETLAPLYGKHIAKSQMVKLDHKGVVVDHQIKQLDYIIWSDKLYLLLLGESELSIYECGVHIQRIKKLQVGKNSNLLVSKRRALIYNGEKNYAIDDQLSVTEIKQYIQDAYIKLGEIFYTHNGQTTQLDILDEDIIQKEEEVLQTVLDEVKDQTFNIGQEYISLHVRATFEGPIETPTEVSVMNSPLTISNPQKLPLTVQSFKGASLNNQTFVTSMLFDNNKPFSSNYPKTEFVFRNQFDEEMLINHVIIKSEITNVFRGFPIGAGLIFIAKQENELNDTSAFDNFDKQAYTEWKSQHNSIRPNEPVGYFEFEGEAKEILSQLDVIRPCKYIMLKPTNFRKTPHDHTAHFSMNAIEIKYFAAYGTQIPKVEGDPWALGTVSDCQLIKELRKRINLPQQIKARCKYIGREDLPSNGIVDFEMPFNGELVIRACNTSEYKLLKIVLIGRTCSNLKVNQLDSLIEQVYQKKPGALRVLNLLMKKESKRVLHELDLKKYILTNVLSQEVNEQITEFFCALQQYDEYHNILLQVAQQILSKIEKLVLTESGLEYFIGLLTYTAKFKGQEVTDMVVKCLSVSLSKLKTLNSQDPHLFSVKYGGPQGPVEIIEEEQTVVQKGNQIPLICHRDPLSQILIAQVSGKHQIRRFDVNLLGEFQVEKLSLRFQQTQNSVKFRVQVWVEDLVLDQVYDEWSFVQFTDYVHRNTDVHNYNCLHIGLGGVKARRLLVQLTLGSDNYYSKQQLQIPQNYLTILPEFYGTLINPQLSPLNITEDFRYKTTLLLGDTLYYTYQSEHSILMDSYNVYSKTDLTDHYIVMQHKSIKRNAEYLETAIHKLQSEMQLKSKCGLPTDHLKTLIEQTQLELMKVQSPRNYENNANFLSAFVALLLKVLLTVNGKVENALELIQLIISLGDLGTVTDVALQLIQNKLRPTIEQNWEQLMLEYVDSTTINASLKKKLLQQLSLPLIQSFERLVSNNDEMLFEALVIQLGRLSNQKITEIETPQNSRILELVLQFLIQDSRFRLTLLQPMLLKCTANQIKGLLTEQTLTGLVERGLQHPDKLKSLLDLLFQPHHLESKYTDWAASLLLSEQVNNLVQIEKDSLTYIAKYVIYYCQTYINQHVEQLSIDSLLLLFDFLTRSVKKVSKLKLKSSAQLSDFEDFLQRQHIQVCYPDTIQRLIQLLQKSQHFSIWNKVLKVILMMTPQLQNELGIYEKVVHSYVGCGNLLLMNELLQFTLSITQQEVQQHQTCSNVVQALLPHLGKEDIANVFIVFSQRVQNVSLSNAQQLLVALGQYLPTVGGKDGIANANSTLIQALELTQAMAYLLVQSEQTLIRLNDLSPIIPWYCLNQQSSSTPNSYAHQLLRQICDYMEQLFELLPSKQSLLTQLFAQQYYIDNHIIKNYNQLSTFVAYTQCVQILENVQQQFEKYLTSDEIALQFQSDVYHYLIDQIIKEKQNVKVTLQEEEFASKMKVHNLAGQNVANQDWPLHKKGARSRLALIAMPPGMRSEYHMLFQLDSEVEIKCIKLGIQTYTSDFQDKILGTPSSVLLEMGNSIDELYPVQELQIINDEFYSQFQVKVFAYNAIRSPHRQVRYIGFRMRQPILEQLETSKFIRKLCLGISFISVMGFSSKQHPVDFIYSLQEKTALDLLSKFCRPSYQKTLSHLANDQVVLTQLQNSIDKFMNALNTHSYQLSPLIMAIAKYNHQVGDWLVDKLMEHPEPSHSKLLTQIILGEHVFERFQRLHKYLFPKLLALQVSNHQQQDLLLYEKLAQHFIETYCNVLLLLSNTKKYKQRELQLDVSEQDIMHFVELFELLHTKQVRHLLIKLIVNLTYLPHPYIPIDNVDQILKFTLEKSMQHPYFLEVLGPLALGSQSSVQWMIGQLDNLVNKIEASDLIQFFYTLSTNKQLCDQLLKHLLPLYDAFIEQEGAKSVLKQAGDKTIDLFAKFISYMVQKYHAKFIIEALIRDIKKLETVSDMKFVRQLLVPVLNSEDYVFVQLLFLDEGKFVTDPRLIVAKKLEAQTPTPELVFESQLLISKQRDSLFSQSIIQETCWSKVVYQKNDGDSSMLPHLEDRFFTQSPQLIILNYRLNSVDKTLILYHKGKVEKLNKLDTTYSWEETSLKVFHFNGSEQPSTFVEVQFKAVIEIYDEQGTLIFINCATQEPFLEIEYVPGEPSRIDLKSIGLQDKGTLEGLKIEYFVVGVRQPKQLKALPPIEIPYETTQLLFPQYETNQALQYYSVVPVYQIPSHLKISELKKLISLNRYGLTEQCRLLESQTQLNKIETNDHNTIELVLDAKEFVENLYIKNQTNTHNSQMSIFPIFEELNGVSVMLSVIKKGITQWKNVGKANAWMQFLNELESFCQLPNFFNLFMKNQLCVNLLFDLMAGAPDTQANKKWEEEEQNAVKFIYTTLVNVFSASGSPEVRIKALEQNLIKQILDRIALVSKETKRVYKKEPDVVVKEQSPQKSLPQLKPVKGKKGVGYASDNTGQNQKWNTIEYVEKKTQKSQQLIGLLGIVESFFDFQHWHPSEALLQKLTNTLFESALLPLLESAFRSGSLLEISKEFELYSKYLKIVQSMSQHKVLASVFLKIPEEYYPQQTQSLLELLTSLSENAQIFLNCMNNSKKKNEDELHSLEIAKMIIETHKKMESCITKMNDDSDSSSDEEQRLQTQRKMANQLIKDILAKPLADAYRMLLSDLRFNYIDMKISGRYKHHYQSSISSQINQDKIVRLAQEFADMSTSLPIEHTNAIFVRADKERVDVMKALVMGAKGTPYAHGAFLFDIYADDSYPNAPPKMNLSTTGNGKVRFNPNLYSCGKVCLSLLGTWRGNASENWDPKISTLLQVLVSTQAIIMSEEVYFNEPGFEQEANTEEGEKKNEGYSNIVRYCNIRYAMIDQIRDPPKGFETIIRRHFYLKKQEIMEEVNKWVELAETKEAVYTGLLSDHNSSWCNEFKKGKKIYQKKLQEAVKELEDELNKLQPPSAADLEGSKVLRTHIKNQPRVKNIKEDMANLDEVDVSYSNQQQRDFEMTDEGVQDRWSRYIGAMGMDAVKKQANSTVLVSGMGPLGVEVAKNIVLSGVKMLTVHDSLNCTNYDLSGQFFIEEKDIGKNRALACWEKLQQLNSYVRVNHLIDDILNIDVSKYTMIIVCITYPNEILFKLSQICRSHKVKLIISSVDGVFLRVFNDFGSEFIVEDKNGEQTIEYVIKNVELDKGIFHIIGKHDFQDNDLVFIDNIEGMIDQNGKSINKTLHRVKVLDKSTILIQLTNNYTNYVRNGTIKNVKVPTQVNFLPYTSEFIKNPIFDQNMLCYDFQKTQNAEYLHSLYNQKSIENKEFEKLFNHYSKLGEFPPLSAYLGGFVAQEAIKGLTNKFMPVLQVFYADCCEVLENQISTIESPNRSLARFVGVEIQEKIEKAKVFMVGCGAIGCELLKNFAMLNLGVQGSLTITDPDHIEVSNLNRQFLFREKHLHKPKSQTAAAAIIQMNPLLRNHIIARLDKVHDSTEHIYTDQFFEDLDIVANALDNVAARRYVDKRCVNAHIPLLESGTLGPKGHVQCILPFQTESYGSSNDPVEEGEIPYCTLKMFPEETFHCVEFARDKFGKHFSARPKQLIKMMADDYIPSLEDNKPLREGLKLLINKPNSFEDCIKWARGKFQKYFVNDIKQLMYTYPEDAKTKDGNLFWTMPKRPPKPIIFDPQNELHSQFVATFAYLRAKMFGLQTVKEWRSKEYRAVVAQKASEIIYPEWQPSEEKKKNISDKVAEKEKQAETTNVQEQTTQEETETLFKQFKSFLPVQLVSDEFEKDNDQNGHIDFIHSFGNLRAANYKLEPMDWLTVKIKAGRIVPALATTTAVVAGLQTIELIKTLKNVKFAQMKNAFINLATPYVQLTEPGIVPKIKINDKVTVTLWDRWEQKITKQTTIGELFERLTKQYELHPRDVFLKAQPIYMEIMYVRKSEEKKHFLSQPLVKLLDVSKYIDLTINFTLTPESTEILKGIPIVRLILD